MQKARRHPQKGLRPLEGARFQGLFHSSDRGSFHLSLTVLVRYRSLGSVQPCGGGPADSRRIPRDPRYSGAVWHPVLHFAYGTVTLCGHAFLRVPLCIVSRAAGGPTTPGAARDSPGLGFCAFARHYLRNRFYFLFLRVLRCFSSPGSLLANYGFICR